MRYKWLLFDADGTLFDFERAEEMALQDTFVQLGQPFEAQYLAEYRQINHQIWLDFEQGRLSSEELKTRRFQALFEAIGLDYDPLDFSARYLSNLTQGTFLLDGAEETVRLLSSQFNLALITNGLKSVQRPRLEKSSIKPYFRAVIISEEVGAVKPDPQIFDIAFAQMNHPAKNEVLIIGDSLSSDIQGGRDYGLDTCWFNPERRPNGQVQCTFEIQKLAELAVRLRVEC
ncbi:MAG: YjjG family noncanonical pyrimidine nucleotidase [Chloroflexota bacterium]